MARLNLSAIPLLYIKFTANDIVSDFWLLSFKEK